MEEARSANGSAPVRARTHNNNPPSVCLPTLQYPAVILFKQQDPGVSPHRPSFLFFPPLPPPRLKLIPGCVDAY